MHDQERGSFYASLADGEYRLAAIPALKEQWLEGMVSAASLAHDDTTIVSGPEKTPTASVITPGTIPTHEVSVIVRGGKLAGIRVGEGEPTMSFARSRDFEHKWTDAESGAEVTVPGVSG